MMIQTQEKPRLAIQKSLIPLGWDPSSTEGFNEWAQHIHAEARLCSGPERPARLNHELANALINMSRLVSDAKSVLK